MTKQDRLILIKIIGKLRKSKQVMWFPWICLN